MTRALAALVLAGCFTGPVTQEVVANTAPPRAKDAAFVLEPEGLGPIRAGTRATFAELQAMFRMYRVASEGRDSGFLFNMFDGGERMFYVVPSHEDELVFGVHVTSRRIRERAHGWRVGDVFRDRAAIDRCECWGSPAGQDEVAACYHVGSHIAVVFERGAHGLVCAGVLDQGELDGVIGSRVDRLVWQPERWGGP